MAERSLTRPLRALAAAGVDFIVVGGVAAVLNGAPVNTFDLDVVHSREPNNISRLLTVLEELDAVFRIQPERRLRPNASHLAGPGQINLTTPHGYLDLLGTIGNGLAYDDLMSRTELMDIGGGLCVHVLDLETLIAIKEELGGEKDRAVLPLLRRTLAERNIRRSRG